MVIDYCERNKIDIEQTQQSEVKKNTRWSKQEDALMNEENINESGKIYFRNLPYTVEEKDLQEMFESYGPIAELHLPIDSETKQIKVCASNLLELNLYKKKLIVLFIHC